MFIPTIEVSIHHTLLSLSLSLCMHTRHSLAVVMGANSFALSDNVFLPTIQSQGTDEQREKWLPLVQNYKIIGAYAQTEIGHGN